MKGNQLKQLIKEEIRNILKEIGEGNAKPYEWIEEIDDEYGTTVYFITDNNITYLVDLKYYISEFPHLEGLPSINVEFTVKSETEKNFLGNPKFKTDVVVNKGEVFRVMATITNIIKHYLKDNKIISYQPEKKLGDDFGKQRDNLYKAFIKKAIPNIKFEQIGKKVLAIIPNN
jgi:hypothetical protein